MRARRPSELRGGAPLQDQNSGRARWLVSYADFITLLFAFFTTLYAISVTDATKAERLVRSIRESFGDALFELDTDAPGLLEEYRGAPVRIGEDLAALHPDEPGRRLDLLGERLNQLSKETGRASGLVVSRTEEGLVISLADTVFFAGGGTELLVGPRERLGEVAALLREVPNHVRVEGHTDNQPIATAQLEPSRSCSSSRSTGSPGGGSRFPALPTRDRSFPTARWRGDASIAASTSSCSALDSRRTTRRSATTAHRT